MTSDKARSSCVENAGTSKVGEPSAVRLNAVPLVTSADLGKKLVSGPEKDEAGAARACICSSQITSRINIQSCKKRRERSSFVSAHRQKGHRIF